MIKDCIFYNYGNNMPEDLKEIIRDSHMVLTTGINSGVSCNYINGKYINITGISDFNKQRLCENVSLSGMLGRIKPESLLETSLCIKLYNDLLFNMYDLSEAGTGETDIRNILFNEFNQNDKYNEISPLLKDSRGWLVWRYQLFNILSLFFYESEKINIYIKGLNSKKAETINELQNLKINDFCVYDIIRELSLPTSLMTYANPNLRDALILNHELKIF